MDLYLTRFKTWIKNVFKHKWVKWVGIFVFSVLLFLVGLYISIYLGVFGKLPTTEELSSIKQEQATQLLDKDGKLIGKYYIYDRQPVKFEDFPQYLKINLLVVEVL